MGDLVTFGSGTGIVLSVRKDVEIPYLIEVLWDNGYISRVNDAALKTVSTLWRPLNKNGSIKVGSLVASLQDPLDKDLGLVLKDDVDMWGMETIPRALEVYWSKLEETIVEYADELEVLLK